MERWFKLFPEDMGLLPTVFSFYLFANTGIFSSVARTKKSQAFLKGGGKLSDPN